MDAYACWDPVPVIGMKDVPGAIEVIRGGDVISYLGFNVTLRPWMEKNGETIEKFLAAVSEADKWMRKNPKQAAAIGTRWIPGLKLDVAETAMQYNIQQVDRRISAHNYRALWKAQDTLQRLGVIKSTFDVNKHIEPKFILNVMKTPGSVLRSAAHPRGRDDHTGFRVQALRCDEAVPARTGTAFRFLVRRPRRFYLN